MTMPATNVVVNNVEISASEQERIFREFGLRLPSGRYWYDRISGAWGGDGTPTQGFTRPGLELGGPLPEDATVKSGGWLSGLTRTRTYVNGRELAQSEGLWLAQVLMQAGVPLWAGRYWFDAQGNFGAEGGPPLVNVPQLVAALQARGQWQQMQGGGGQAYQQQTAGGYIGGDGQTSYFFDPETGASVMTGG
jgi:hypothetical protein